MQVLKTEGLDVIFDSCASCVKDKTITQNATVHIRK